LTRALQTRLLPVMAEQPAPIRSFGRIKARPLKPRQEVLLAELFPRLKLPDPAAGPIDPRALFPKAAKLGLEIGFGGGEHLVAEAKLHPDWGFLGAEPFLNGVGVCLRLIDEAGIGNVRLHQGDARDLLIALPNACLDRVDILFPDPWPKKKHWKRRLVQPDFLAALARVLKPGAEVRFATDWADYAAWTLERFVRSPHFTWTAERCTDWRQPWPDHAPTRYEQKRLGDCAPVFFAFRQDIIKNPNLGNSSID
jgi:tRNA (guanine-N7-)-methyltransferase